MTETKQPPANRGRFKVPEGRTEEGYVLASPRVIDQRLVERTFAEIQACSKREEIERTLELLSH